MADGGVVKNQGSPHAKLRSVDLAAVSWTEGFWADRYQQACDVSLPFLLELACSEDYGHALQNMQIAAGLEDGEYQGTHWQDAWLFKWVETAAVVWQESRDHELEIRMDGLIALFGQVQEPDGYLASQTRARGFPRFEEPARHELYTMGHALTAACLHHRITGKTNFLDIACRIGDFVSGEYRDRPERMAHFPYNPSVVMGAVELYRTTGRQRYLELANAVIDSRGRYPQGTIGQGDHCQDRIPLRDETEVVGHSVFWTYLFAGATDAVMETGDRTLCEALDRLWHDFVETKMYVTGGACAVPRGYSMRLTAKPGQFRGGDHFHEGVGPQFSLPNASAYNETCAQVGVFMWNWRMLLLTGEERFADVMEREIYNGVLSGISLDGRAWSYSNILRCPGSGHNPHTQPVGERFLPALPPRRGRICCPTNVLRTFVELKNMLYATDDEGGVWLHLYGGSTLECGDIRLVQETRYPWNATVTLRFDSVPETQFSLHVRIPQWAHAARLTLNGVESDTVCDPGSYACLRRLWAVGDELVIDLPMRIHLVEGNPRVEETRNHVAVVRGPMVYCLEAPDLPEGVRLTDVRIPRGITLLAWFDDDLLGGVTVLEGEAVYREEDPWDGVLYRDLATARARPFPIRLVPYYAWANRGPQEMSVWLPLSG